MASNTKSSGEKIFRTKCAHCHTNRDNRGIAHKQQDPYLNGLFGWQSGTVSGYSYSTVNKKMTETWGESTWNDCLLNPNKQTPGPRMEPHEHADLIAYLREQKKTAVSLSYEPCISKANIFQIQRYIPISWRKPIAPTHHELPRGEKDKDTTKVPQDKIHLLIDSIRSLSAQYQLPEAFKSFSLLQLHSPSSNFFLHPISSLLSASTTLNAFPQGKQLHAQTISLGLANNPFIVSRLCSFYSTIGLIYDAKTIVEGCNSRHMLPWNLLLSAYLRNHFWLDAILAYKKMTERGCNVDKFTYSSVLKACGGICDLSLGRTVHGSLETRGLEFDLFVHNALISMYTKCGAMNDARKLFNAMHDKDVVTWNCMISGYSSKRMWKETYELLEKMQLEGTETNTVTWNTIATAHSQMGNHLEALKLIPKMRMRGAFVDSVTLVIGLNSCSSIGYLQLGKEIHGLAVRLHYNDFDNVRNSLITMYSRCKQAESAYSLFRMCLNRSLITWNAMIAGFAIGNLEEETFLVFGEMVKSRVQPNNVTIMPILSLCARIANLCYGRQLHCFLIKNKFDNDQCLMNSLIDMYSKSQRLLVAQRVFNMMGSHDRFSYTSMIAGYGMQGEGTKALKLFNEMVLRGIKPDGITMLAVLSACSHAGLVSQAQMLFKQMISLYEIVPTMEHYSCMSDLYGRARLLRSAEELIDQMPFKPSNAMLVTLLRACRAQGNIEMRERLTRKFLEM